MNERHPQCRLSSADALLIRDADSSVPDGALADRFGLTRGYVNSIRSGKRRRFLDTDPTIYRTLQRAT